MIKGDQVPGFLKLKNYCQIIIKVILKQKKKKLNI